MELSKHNLKAQISEIEMLQSMFCKPGKLKIEDRPGIKAITFFINDDLSESPPFLDFTINLEIGVNKYELCVNLPHEYPTAKPDIFIRSSKMNRTLHAKLNKHLNECLAKWIREPCIFNAISWLQYSAADYILNEEPKVEREQKPKNESLVRYWIYSHHIYSKTKRKEISSLANDLGITGFCKAGKPGVICVEGYKDDCDEWWSRIKSMNWKRIFCKVTEDVKNKKFEYFEEIS